MKFSKLALVSSLAALSITVMSCSSTKKAEETSKEAVTDTPKAAETPAADTKTSSTSELKTVYFDFDKYVIRKDQTSAADSLVETLKANPALKIQIQGNTDDRGSSEYNLALGTRRANSLKKYLVAHGISEDKVTTVSYGKERPAVQGNDESAWSKNRRDDVVEQK